MTAEDRIWGCVVTGPASTGDPQPRTIADGVERVQPYPRGLLRAISLLTALGVALQLLVGWEQKNSLYPITGYSMFSSSTDDSRLEVRYEGITASGRTVVLRAEDLGMTDLQMRRSVGRAVMRPLLEGDQALAESRLGYIASLYDDGQDDELVQLSRWNTETWVDGRTSEPELVLRWSR